VTIKKDQEKQVEQAELIEELSSKLQEMEAKLAETSIANREEGGQAIVTTHVVASMSLGLLPIPLFDIVALTGAQLNMLGSLSRHYEVEFKEKIAKAALNSLITGATPTLTVMGFSSILKIIPGVGSVAGGVSISVLSGAMIHASGQVFIRHFEAGGTLDDFDSKEWLDYFKEQLERSKAYVKGKYDQSKSSIGKGIDGIKDKLGKSRDVVAEVVEDSEAEVKESDAKTA
jgi:uncharacterized protein (DUF697 family)